MTESHVLDELALDEPTKDAGIARADEGPHVHDRPIEIFRPDTPTGPFIFASPHSGRRYPPEMMSASRLDLLSLRRSEDGFVDEIFADVVAQGSPLLAAQFPRVYVDVNREAYELDPRMFADPLPAHVNTRSTRVAGGLGTIARVVTDGEEIYRRKLTFAEAERRILACYRPYHGALSSLIDETVDEHGCAVLIDCHSMPSVGGPMDFDAGRNRTDFVLGDRYGASCAPALSSFVEHTLVARNYRVMRNNPYAGGFTTSHYGRPDRGVHALQIEINRALYMNEADVERGDGIAELRAVMGDLVEELRQIDTTSLLPRR
ncbi:MAG: N-formylglutamate amidohydrolase [Pseudomonadota bacterium]